MDTLFSERDLTGESTLLLAERTLQEQHGPGTQSSASLAPELLRTSGAISVSQQAVDRVQSCEVCVAGPVNYGQYGAGAVATCILIGLQALAAPVLGGLAFTTYLNNTWISWPSTPQATATALLGLSLSHLTESKQGGHQHMLLSG